MGGNLVETNWREKILGSEIRKQKANEQKNVEQAKGQKVKNKRR